MKSLNGRIGQVKIGGKVRFIDKNDRDTHFYTKEDMALILGHWTVLNWSGEEMPAFRWWLVQEDRQQYSEVTFQPDPAKASPDALNLFHGFAVKPSAGGSCALFREHVEQNVCGGDVELAEFVWDWAADLVQRPGQKCGVALMLRGDKGTGKSVFSNVLAHLVGERYAPIIDSAEGFTGRFSGHLEHALLLVVEEAYHAGNPAHEARLKSLVTGGRIAVERKHIDTYTAESFFRIILTSNADHVLPASAGERRFVCLDVKPTRKQDGAFFRAMLAELEAGGYGALMADLMAREIADRDFSKPPMTAALSDQIRLSLKPDESWWASLLATGAVSFSHPPEGVDGELEWPLDDVFTVERAHLLASFRQSMPNFRGPATPEALGRFLGVVCPNVGFVKASLGYGRRANCYRLPPRREALATFLSIRPGLRLDAEASEIEPEGGGEAGRPTPKVIALGARRRA